MDVNDLKGLYAESNKRMNTALEHVKHELAGVRTGVALNLNGSQQCRRVRPSVRPSTRSAAR